MAGELITIGATILGGFISGVVGLITSDYARWRAEKSEIEEWCEKVEQQIEYADVSLEESDGEVNYGEAAANPGTVTETLHSVGTQLSKLMGEAPSSVDAETLQLISKTRECCQEVVDENQRPNELSREGNAPYNLLKEVDRIERRHAGGFSDYLADLIF